ncbi:PASTA domain-containing protein [Pleionea sediminis]|uniref:PASTA domain-containing protein n=1 Tax=Pleionea sediminis TaxID=2569479 RepID=UPI0011859988|nr:PASTA domain-containing protein [Pleionea sediminis]
MSTNPNLNELVDNLSAPLGDVISAVGRGVAEAQQALDKQVIQQLESLNINDDQMVNNLRKIGYQPTWYQIPEANAELLMAISVSGQSNSVKKQGSAPINLYAAPVNATYINSFDYDIKSFSKVSFKVVPVPPSTQASEAKVVPSLVQRTAKEAKELLEKLGIVYQFSNQRVNEDARVTDVSHLPGDVITANETLVLTHANVTHSIE